MSWTGSKPASSPVQLDPQQLKQLKEEIEASTQKALNLAVETILSKVDEKIKKSQVPGSSPRDVVIATQEEGAHATTASSHGWVTRHFKSYHAAMLDQAQATEEAHALPIYDERAAELVELENSTSFDALLEEQSSSVLHSPRIHRSVSKRSKWWSHTSQRLGCHGTHRWLMLLISSKAFEHAMGFCVVANALCIGLETNYQANPAHITEPPPYPLVFSEYLFCAIFSIEMVLRIGVNPFRFFDWDGDFFAWNLFDVFVLGLLVVDVHARATHVSDELYYLECIRFLRILRIWRVVRLFEELRTILASMYACIESLVWALLLFAILLYMFGVAMCQTVIAAGPQAEHSIELQKWFGSVLRSILTGYETILGGVSWDEPLRCLMDGISPLIAIPFSFFVALCIFVIMNTLTGAFVAKITTDANNQQAAIVARHLREAFFREDTDGKVDLHEFQAKVQTAQMQEYFRGIDVDPKEFKEFFGLLDIDGSGGLSPEELVNGCLRLSRQAQALDIAILMKEVSEIHAILKPPASKQKGKALAQQ